MYARVARRQNLPVMSDVILRVSNVRRSHLLASPKRCRFADVRGKSEILSGQVSRRSCATAEDEEARSLLVQDPEVEECVISFDLSAASVLVLTAPSGFGKSTLLKALAGLVPIDGGVGSSVLLRDESCSGLVPAVRGGLSEWRSRVRYVPAGGGAALFKESTPRKTLELIARYQNQNTHHPSRFRFWNVFQGTPASRACLDSSTLKAASHLEALGLPSEVLDKAWSSLSAGVSALRAPPIPFPSIFTHAFSTRTPFSFDTWRGTYQLTYSTICICRKRSVRSLPSPFRRLRLRGSSCSTNPRARAIQRRHSKPKICSFASA